MILKFQSWTLIALLFAVVACVDQDFDEPSGEAPNFELPSNIISIAELKAKHIEGEFESIEEELALRAVVIADDESGNFFKTLIIQDESGGLELKINTTGLYNNFPIGREVYVLLNGLYLGDYRGVVQLGGTLYNDDGEQSLGGIEDIFVDKHLLKGKKDQEVRPQIVTIDQLNSTHISTLIQLEEVQVFEDDAGTPYADAVNKFALNLRVQDCRSGLITLRSSGYAIFADELADDGNGTLVGVYSVFGATRQMYIRDLDDVFLTGERCEPDGDIGDDDMTTPISIAALRDGFLAGETTGTAGTRIQGIVISDRIAENITSRNLVIQDGNRGLVVRLDESHPYNLGDSVKVWMEGLLITEFNGLLQVNAPNNVVSRISTDNTLEPRVLTIADLLANIETYESTLVKIEEATITSTEGTSYRGNHTLSDATGMIDFFGTSYSSFANTALPTNVVDVTAIAGQATQDMIAQLSIRNLEDVEGAELLDSDLFKVDFQNQTNFEAAEVEGWQNISLKGGNSRTWLTREFSGNLFIQASGFQDENAEVDTWFISPEIDFASQTSLSFESGIAFWTHNGLSVLISTDYDGSNVESATWETLTGATLAGETDENYAWIASGTVDLSAYAGKGYIAFRHIGDNTANTGTSRLDNIVIE